MKYLFIFLPFFAMAQDSTLYRVRFDSAYLYENSMSYQQLYLEDRSFELIDSFRYNGAYYELRKNGWYKQVLPELTPCNQHFGEVESHRREKMDTSEVKLLVWNGCSLAEIKATKLKGYNLDRSNLYYDRNGNILRPTKTDFLFVYISDGKWVKPSHVIKEL